MNRSHLPVNGHTAHPEPAIDIREQDPPFEPIDPVRPPKGAPNVLVVLIDDMGFGASSAFGGPCRMPTAERLSDDGLRYTRFHTTALCAPTRAALLTGRNHHSCGMGGLPDTATSAPGYTSRRPAEVATLARTLQLNGYATGAFGKMHQTPRSESTAAGPFDRWPTNEGFDRFYGFLGADTHQFSPNLIDGTTPIEPPATEAEGYHLSEDLVDKAISWIQTNEALEPGRPWFCYLSFGACHAPFHVPSGWRSRYRGEFAQGWDAQRERTFARQKEIGVVPEDADLSPWLEDIPHWSELSPEQRIASERLMETYAAFAEHTDVQTGRLVDAIADTGDLSNTLILYVLGDNGASAEGGLEGTLNEVLTANGFADSAERITARLDEIGGPMTNALYPVGWALAMDTPYPWMKQVASHYGGTRNGMIVHWPAGFAARGELRHQWHHCIDVAPTILEAAGLPEPVVVDGVKQRPIEGTSFRYTFDAPDAPDRHITQYFEMVGNRGVYHRGWTAVTKHRTPWLMNGPKLPAFSDDTWELYDTNVDWTQSRDIAAEHPDKLAELQQLFLAEAARYQVLPLDDRLSEKLNPSIAGRRSLMGGRKHFDFPPDLPGLPEDAAPNFKNTSFRLRAAVTVTTEPANGVLVSQGGRFGGWSLYVSDNRVSFCYNLCDLERTYVRASTTLVPGDHEIGVTFTYDGGGTGKGGEIVLDVDGVIDGAGRIDRSVPFFFSLDETFDVGRSRGTPVTEEYGEGLGTAFTGALRGLHVELLDDQVEPPAEQIALAMLSTH